MQFLDFLQPRTAHHCSFPLSPRRREEGLAFQQQQGLNDYVDPKQAKKYWLSTSVVDPLHTFDATGQAVLSQASGPFLPQWQAAPVLQISAANENLFEEPIVSETARNSIASKAAVLGGFQFAPPGSTNSTNPTTSLFATLLSMANRKQMVYLGDPISNLFIPIFDKLEGNDKEVVGVLMSTIHWRSYLQNILPTTNHGIYVVVENFCDGNYTYLLQGTEAMVVGFGDLHDRAYSDRQVVGHFRTAIIDDGTLDGVPLNQEGCPYTFYVYPTRSDLAYYETSDPIIMCLSVASVFVFAIMMFFFYDHLVVRCGLKKARSYISIDFLVPHPSLRLLCHLEIRSGANG